MDNGVPSGPLQPKGILDVRPRYAHPRIKDIAWNIHGVVKGDPEVAENLRAMFRKAAKLPGIREWHPGELYDSGDSIITIPEVLQAAWIAVVHDAFSPIRTNNELILVWPCRAGRKPNKTTHALQDLTRDLIFMCQLINWTDDEIDDIEEFVAEQLPEDTIPRGLRHTDTRIVDKDKKTVGEIAAYFTKTPSLISQLCNAGTIKSEGVRRKRRVSLVSARMYFVENEKRKHEAENRKLAGDARKDTADIEQDASRLDT